MKVLITGASSGIGRDMAYVFAEKKCDLVLVARDREKLEEVRKKITGVRVDIEVCDLVDEGACKDLYERYREIDILVNNAGFGLIGEFDETDLDRELSMIDTNVKALHILTKLYLGDMIKRDEGRILNVASVAGFLPGPLMATYYATKNYVVALSESIREELRRKHSNVKISILCPGPVRTNFDKVAGVDFSLNYLSSEYVARYAVEKLFKEKFYIVPGFSVKLLRFLSKIIPNYILARVVYLSQKRKRNIDK